MNAERPRPRAFRLDDSGKVVLDEATPARAAPVVEEAPDPYEREAELALTAGDQSEQAVEVVRGEPQPREARGGVAHPEPAVDHQARAPRLDDEAVAFAAAAERGEAHQGRQTLERPPRPGRDGPGIT